MTTERTPAEVRCNAELGLVERLRQRRVTNWVHSTGTTPKANGTKPDPLCQEAANEIERLRELLSEVSDQARHPDYDWPLCLCKDVANALGPNHQISGACVR